MKVAAERYNVPGFMEDLARNVKRIAKALNNARMEERDIDNPTVKFDGHGLIFTYTARAAVPEWDGIVRFRGQMFYESTVVSTTPTFGTSITGTYSTATALKITVPTSSSTSYTAAWVTSSDGILTPASDWENNVYYRKKSDLAFSRYIDC